MLCFTNDSVVFATSKEGLQTTLYAMNCKFIEYISLKINTTKTKTLVFYKNNISTINIILDYRTITQVDYFKYLGRIITEDGKSTKKIRNRIGQAKNIFLKKKKLLHNH